MKCCKGTLQGLLQARLEALEPLLAARNGLRHSSKYRLSWAQKRPQTTPNTREPQSKTSPRAAQGPWTTEDNTEPCHNSFGAFLLIKRVCLEGVEII